MVKDNQSEEKMFRNDLTYNGGENFDLRQMLLDGKNKKLDCRTRFFETFIENLVSKNEFQHLRIITSRADREVKVKDHSSGKVKSMLMFGSNNYLGLSNHHYVIEKAQRTLRQFGAGIGGPPLLNGYTMLHRELEERLADIKKV